MINMVWSDKNIQKIQTGIDENAYNRMTAERRGGALNITSLLFSVSLLELSYQAFFAI
ncbi:MAG TPA: hypothetical protein VK057_02655 [Bacillota bacterium]|nr:hypothetical protein [Bacillota bacterium]